MNVVIAMNIRFTEGLLNAKLSDIYKNMKLYWHLSAILSELNATMGISTTVQAVLSMSTIQLCMAGMGRY